jgi:zinc knuckle protein
MTSPADIQCFRCEKYGHIAAECTELTRATTKAEHLARIDRFIERYQSREIDASVKQRLINQENRLWYGGELPAALRR